MKGEFIMRGSAIITYDFDVNVNLSKCKPEEDHKRDVSETLSMKEKDDNIKQYRLQSLDQIQSTRYI